MNFAQETRTRRIEQDAILTVLSERGWGPPEAVEGDPATVRCQGASGEVLELYAPETEATPFKRNNGPIHARLGDKAWTDVMPTTLAEL